MLKFEGKFKIGNVIRAHAYRSDTTKYIEGVVIEEDHINESELLVVTIRVTTDTEFDGAFAFEKFDIALETFLDYDERIELITS